MQVIDYLHLTMAIMFFVSAIIKIKQGQPEHFFTRIMNSAWFIVTVFEPDMQVMFVRNVSTSLIVIMLFAEITSPFFRWKKRKAK